MSGAQYKTFGEMIMAEMRGESPTLPTTPKELKWYKGALDGYSVSRGYDGCTSENVSSFLKAYNSLRSRVFKEVEALPKAPVPNPELIEWLEACAFLESQAQDAEDRDNLKRAWALRDELRVLKSKRPI